VAWDIVIIITFHTLDVIHERHNSQ